jgi:L-aspartate oxidase
VFSIKGETGKHIMKALWEKAVNLGVKFIEEKIVELIVKKGTCYGIIDSKGENHIFDAIILASGGYSGLYKYTAGSPNNIGLLIGDYIRKGGRASNLEFVQFHPTAYISKRGRAVLISEAVRGRGALIVDSKGKRFVNELAPRDVVARAIYRKLEEGEEVYLDARNVENIDRLFPGIYSALLNEDYDMKKDLIPISPVAHYTIGGIAVDKFWRTDFQRLYAIGEVADIGFHGANRLPSNSSLECVVGGLEVARTIARDLERLGKVTKEVEASEMEKYNLDPDLLEKVREIMWKHVGIERNERGLIEAINYFNREKRLPQQISPW